MQEHGSICNLVFPADLQDNGGVRGAMAAAARFAARTQTAGALAVLVAMVLPWRTVVADCPGICFIATAQSPLPPPLLGVAFDPPLTWGLTAVAVAAAWCGLRWIRRAGRSATMLLPITGLILSIAAAAILVALDGPLHQLVTIPGRGGNGTVQPALGYWIAGAGVALTTAASLVGLARPRESGLAEWNPYAAGVRFRRSVDAIRAARP